MKHWILLTKSPIFVINPFLDMEEFEKSGKDPVFLLLAKTTSFQAGARHLPFYLPRP